MGERFAVVRSVGVIVLALWLGATILWPFVYHRLAKQTHEPYAGLRLVVADLLLLLTGVGLVRARRWGVLLFGVLTLICGVELIRDTFDNVAGLPDRIFGYTLAAILLLLAALAVRQYVAMGRLPKQAERHPD